MTEETKEAKSVSEFIKAKVGDRDLKCPICEGQKWMVVDGFNEEGVGEQKNYEFVMLAQTGLYATDTKTVSFVFLACLNCAYTYIFHKKMMKMRMNNEEIG